MQGSKHLDLVLSCLAHKELAVTNVVLAGPSLFSFSDVKQLGITDPPTARVDSIKIGLIICQAFGSASLLNFSAVIGHDMFLSVLFFMLLKGRICSEISFEINI
jgi:hypothetical protein